MAHSLPLGGTKEGRDWCLKALHPSDPITDVQGIPDEDAAPSAHLNYQSTFTLQPRTGATGTWSFDATLLPHPVDFMWYGVKDSTSGTTLVGNFMNTQLPGPSHFNKIQNFWSYAQRFRMTYCSVTCYQDGPDLANQGTIAVCQAPFSPMVYNPSYLQAGVLKAVAHVHQYSQADMPDFTVAQSMPNAYFNNSKFGAYVPLKLTRTHQQWISAADAAATSQVVATSEGPVDAYTMPLGAAYGMFPHTALSPAFYNNGSGGAEPTACMANGMVAHICARNLAVTTSFQFFVRMGFEIQCSPGSLYTTHLRISPAPDQVALDNYFRIARELKDAYPADYNDLGKIWDVISSVAKTLGPALSVFGPIGSAVGLGIAGAAGVGDTIKAALSKRVDRALEGKPGPGKTGSAADKAIVQEMVASSSQAPVITVVSKRKRHPAPHPPFQPKILSVVRRSKN